MTNTPENMAKSLVNPIIEAIREEFFRAAAKHGLYNNSYHESYAVILEEVDELWDEIKKKKHDDDRIKEEAVQIAAMCIKLIVSAK